MAGQGKDAAFSLDDEAFSSDHFRMFEFKVCMGIACGYLQVCCHLRAAAAALCMVPYACLKPVDLPGGPCAVHLAYRTASDASSRRAPGLTVRRSSGAPRRGRTTGRGVPLPIPVRGVRAAALRSPTLLPSQCRITSARTSVLTLHASCRREGQAARPSEVSVQWHGLPGVPQGELQPLSCA